MRYRSPRVVRLGGWSPQLPAGFPVSRGTRVHDQPIASPSPTGLSPSSACLPRQLGSPTLLGRVAAANPTMPHNPEAATAAALARPRFGLNPVRSPLLGVSRLIPLPRGTKMFQFPRFPTYGPRRTCSSHHGRGVAAFGDLRIKACSPLPGAYRGAPRPSSAPGPKASTRRL